MSDPASILQAFGDSAGMPGLRFDARGHAVFRTEADRLLGLEQAGDAILVYVGQPVRYDSSDWYLRACKRAHYRHLGDDAIQPALRDYEDTPHLLALTRLQTQAFTEQRLQQTLESLSQWLDALGADT